MAYSNATFLGDFQTLCINFRKMVENSMLNFGAKIKYFWPRFASYSRSYKWLFSLSGKMALLRLEKRCWVLTHCWDLLLNCCSALKILEIMMERKTRIICIKYTCSVFTVFENRPKSRIQHKGFSLEVHTGVQKSEITKPFFKSTRGNTKMALE